MVSGSSVSFEGELMHQVVPAMPISGNKSFHVVRGSSNKHLLFSIGVAGHLYLIRPDDSVGRCSLTDIGALFGIPQSSVVSFLAVTQAPDLSIYVAFTVNSPSEHDATEIYIVRPTQPSEWEPLNNNSNISTWLLRGESDPKLRTYKLYLGPVTGTDMTYPLLVAAYTNLERKVTDVARLNVNTPESRWSFDHSFSLPEDPKLLIDACCGYLAPDIHGMFCLYENQGNIRLTFSGLVGHINFSLQVRPDAKSLATFTNSNGYTDLLVGGSNLYHYPAAICGDSFPASDPEHFTIASSGSIMSGLQQLFVAQERTDISVFTCNNENSVVYQQFAIEQKDDEEYETLKAFAPPVPLLTSEQGGGHFTAHYDAASGSQFLYILDPTGQLTYMEQSGGTRIWQSHPILVPSSETNRDITTFTTHVHLTGPNGAPLAQRSFLLSSSSPISINVNGRTIYGTPEGVIVKTDSGSNLTIIHQVDDLNTVSFTIRDTPAEVILGRAYTYDPSTRVLGKLGSLTADRLRNATLSDGSRLLSDSISDSEVENAANMLSQLQSSAQKLASGTDQGASDTSSTGLSAALGDTSSGKHSDSVLWDIWHWLSNSATNVKNWFIDAWEFVVETAEGVYRFVLKAVSHVMKAVSWVFEKLKVGLKALVDLVGFLFNWPDILDMHNIIVGVTNCGLDVVADSAKSCASYVDSYFGEFETIINQLDPTSEKYDQTATLNEGPGEKTGPENALSTPAGNWSNYQIEHGGVGKAMESTTSQTTTSHGVTDIFSQLWTDILSPALESLSKLGSHLMDNLKNLFSNSSQFKFGDLLKHVGVELLRDLVNVIRKLTVGLIEFCGHLVADLKTGLNATINIPLLSPLYRRISGGNELSMIDAIALLAAVPITVSFKAVTGKSPRDIKSLAHLVKSASNKSTDQVATPPQVGPRMLFANAQAVNFAAVLAPDSPPSGNSTIQASQSGSPSFLTWFYGLVELGQFALPAINMISLPWTMITWYTPDSNPLQNRNFPNSPNIDPAGAFKSYTPASLVMQIVAAVFAFPRDILPLQVLKEPAPTCRVLIWVLETLNIPWKVVFRNKRTIALGSVMFSVLQTPLTCITIYEDLTADESKFPGRDKTVVSLAAAQNACSQVAKISSGIALHLNGEEPWSFMITVIAGGGTFISQQFLVCREYGTGASYTSLRSLAGM